jgi:tRNA nucleotidyltransferase/poly(A) polymerase
MSDYMFMLESHLSADQSRVITLIQTAASEAGVNVFLTGGALRDMLAGFPILDLDFTVEGSGLKLAKSIVAKSGAEILEEDETRKGAKLRFPSGVLATISMARQEKFSKPGSKPHVQAATIHEDLRGRDFTVNAIALSLNAASRGLLLDPNNGVGDIAQKELRTVTNFTLYDDPIRLLRLQRFKVRLGFTIAERTLAQYANAREAGLEQRITPLALLEELRHVSNAQNIADLVKVLEDEKLLPLFSASLSGPHLNMPGLLKLQKAKQMIPQGGDFRLNNFGLFLNVLTEKLSAAEKAEFIKSLAMDETVVEQWQKLESRSKKLEKELKSAKLQKPSLIYQVLSKAPGDQVLFLLLRSPERLVQDRIRNYLQKYLPMAQEVSDAEVLATGVPPNTPKFEKARTEMIATRLDARPKKIPPPTPPVEAPAPTPTPLMPTHAFARKSG